MFFPLRALTGALVIDSRGFKYGYLDGFDEENMELVVRTYREVGVEGINERELLELIGRFLSRRKLFGRINVEEVVAKELNLSGKPRLEDYLEYARIKGIEVPRGLARERVVDLKGRVHASEVESVGITVFSDEEGNERVVRIVLLKTPREANYRGAEGDINFVGVVGKRAIDVCGRYLGVVEDVVLGKEVGVAVRLAKVKYAKTSVENAPEIPQRPRIGVGMAGIRGVGDYVLVDVKYSEGVEEV